ncbi:MAG: SMP-30/gluconolactonase/LRE family protein [Gammaproteobacteria bacterium]|nr:gluconolactonase [Gammaproteobacteria bacterium]MDP6094959.1 SMP-30/gluconolactonase/LRE family protein [Gammaproteobacteria bacterium]MDP7455154.1 SMP-30/gluconolactonase/LRE family protein [Gammaproteobacteria bacterium]HJO12490.1 SMP-30/gluconolactonase/LRE family protein [Gammaproteobacteria bacterium]
MNWKFIIKLIIPAAISTTSVGQPAVSGNSGLLANGAEVIEVAGDFLFLEGPVADKSGNLFFTDIDNNRVHRLAANGDISIAYAPSNNANGLTLDLNGNLLICEQSGQRITSMDANGNITVVADSYNGRPFNSPNDVWAHPDGSIYFTDPRYRFPEGEPPQDGEHVYRISPDHNTVTRMAANLSKPNGIVGTEDGRTLYVADTQLRKVFKYSIGADGSLSNREEFADQGSDGMTMDQNSNVYMTWGGGVTIYNQAGEAIEFIQAPQNPANVGFGGADGRTLYMTARTGLYSVRMNVTASR